MRYLAIFFQGKQQLPSKYYFLIKELLSEVTATACRGCLERSESEGLSTEVFRIEGRVCAINGPGA